MESFHHKLSFYICVDVHLAKPNSVSLWRLKFFVISIVYRARSLCCPGVSAVHREHRDANHVLLVLPLTQY